MRVEFVELLCCPAHDAHAPLVTVAEQRDGEDILRGTLGCPVCLAEYPLVDGVVDLRSTYDAQISPHEQNAHAPEMRALDIHALEPEVKRPYDAMRLAALLNVSEPHRRIALCGDVTVVGATLASLADAHCLLVNPPSEVSVARMSALRVDIGARLPLADHVLHGLAVDAQHVALLPDAVRVVQRAGRVVAPGGATVPHGLRELARDTDSWVAEVEPASSAPVTLGRAR